MQLSTQTNWQIFYTEATQQIATEFGHNSPWVVPF